MNEAYQRFEALLNASHKRPADITRETGISSVVFAEWKKGKSQPKTDKLVLIARALDTTVEYIMTGESPDGYYVSGDTAAVAQELFENKDLRMLFDAARDVSPENLRLAAEMLKRFKETNNG